MYCVFELENKLNACLVIVGAQFFYIIHVFFSLDFVKVKEMEKVFKVNGVSQSDVLHFRDCLEGSVRRKNMWDHELKSDKLYTIILHYNQLCN